MRILLTTLLVSAMLAGCASEKAAEPEPDDFGDLGDDFKSTDTTGLIRGVVLTPTIQPIANVDVRILGTDLNTTSNDVGEFGFKDLEPGVYFLEATKLGFNSTQATASVVAADDRPPVVKIQLIPNPSSRPYSVTIPFDGFLECSATAVVISGNVCSLTDIAGVPLDDPLVEYPLDRIPTFIQSELVWESSQPAGDSLELLFSWDCNSNDGFLCDFGEAGRSPVIIGMDEETIMSAQFEGLPFGPERDLMVRVFGTGLEQSGGDAGVTIEQEFTHYTTIFYGFVPDDGWTYIEDGEHLQPE